MNFTIDLSNINILTGITASVIGIVASCLTIYLYFKKKPINKEKEKTANKKKETIKSSKIILGSPINIATGIPYFCILTGNKNNNEFRKGDIKIQQIEGFYNPPKKFISYNQSIENSVVQPKNSEPGKCRLESYDLSNIDPNRPNQEYIFRFSEISYYDYLITNNVLDNTIPGTNDTTFRELYGEMGKGRDFSHSKLSNICGVGIFIITRDKKIIISKSSKYVSVYGNSFSYSASGTMDWNNNLNPFNEIVRESIEEINHQPNINDMYMYGFGYDQKKLYFQFSFFEKTGKSSEEIISNAVFARDYNAEKEELIAVSYDDPKEIIDLIKNNDWEPAAAFNLIVLCLKKFGSDIVNNLLQKNLNNDEIKQKMLYIWDVRAKRDGLLAVMSNRYDFLKLSSESSKYVDTALQFTENDLKNSDVVEIGAGIGRFTRKIAQKAKHVTCIDISKKMIERNEKATTGYHDKIKYLNIFAQDYNPGKKHDIAIVSLVLIHNTNDLFLKKVAEKISNIAKTIYLFEHVDIKKSTTNDTKLRSEDYLLSLFPHHVKKKKTYYQLFEDKILFVKLTEKESL